MPRGVRFGSGEEDGAATENGTDTEASGGGVAETAQPKASRISLVETEKVSRPRLLGLFETDDDAPSTETISRILDTRQIAAAEKEFRREQVLADLGRKFIRLLVAGSLLIFTLCVILVAVYLQLQPVAPDFQVVGAGFVSVSINPLNGAQIAAQQATGKGNYFAAYFTFNSSFTVVFGNPNHKVDIFVDELELIIYYEGFRLGNTRTASFTQPRTTSRTFKVFVAQKGLPVPLNVYYTMFQVMGKKNYFGVDLLMQGRMTTIAGLKSPLFKFRVRCTLVLKSYVVIDKMCYRRNVI